MALGLIKKLTGKDRDLVKEGNILFSNCEYKKASEKYREALEINKNNIEAKNNLKNTYKIISLIQDGYHLFNKKEYSEALFKFKEVLKLNPNDKGAKTKINEIEGKLKEIEKQNKIKELKKDGDRLFNNNEYSKALNKFKEVLKLNPNDIEAKNKVNEIEKLKKEEFNKIKQDLNNIDISNYKEIYNKYKREVFNKDESFFNYYVDKLKELINKLNKENNYKLSVEVGLFLLDIKGIKKVNELIWEFKAEYGVKTLSIKDDVVVVGCWYNKDLGYAPIYALNLKTGKRIWEFKANTSVSTLSIQGDVVVLGCSYRCVYAIDFKNYGLIQKIKQQLTTSLTNIINQMQVLTSKLDINEAKRLITLAKEEYEENFGKCYKHINQLEDMAIDSMFLLTDSISLTNSLNQKIQKLKEDKGVIYELVELDEIKKNKSNNSPASKNKYNSTQKLIQLECMG